MIGEQLHDVGTNSRGVELEVVAVPDDRNPGGLAVIHAMPVNFRRKDASAHDQLQGRNLVPGRKSLSGGDVHSPRVQFRVPDSLRSAAEKRAAEDGVSLSVLAR